MMSGVSLLLLALAFSAVVAAPAQLYENPEEVVIPQKRAALVLDRILIALQKALHEQPAEAYDGPHASALRVPAYLDANDMVSLQDVVMPQKRVALVLDRILIALQKSSLQRRGQAGATGRGRVLRCYFNAVTCF